MAASKVKHPRPTCAKSSDTHQWEGCPWKFFAGSVVTQDGSTVHGAGHVLEVADALLDGERPSQSCLRAAAGDRRVSKERSGGIAGLSARSLPIACPTTARRASTAVPWTAMPGSRAGLSLGLSLLLLAILGEGPLLVAHIVFAIHAGVLQAGCEGVRVGRGRAGGAGGAGGGGDVSEGGVVRQREGGPPRLLLYQANVYTT